MKRNGTIALLLAVVLAIGVACNRDESPDSVTATTSATTETTMTTQATTTYASAPASTAGYDSGASSTIPQTNTSPFATSTVIPTTTASRPSVTMPSDNARATAPRINVADAKRLHDANGAVIVDVRTAEAFALGHIPGAINIPFSSVQTQMPDLPKGKPVIAYCA